MSDEAFLRFVEEGAVPVEEVSRWYCDRRGCDGQPHGPHWHWCDHPPGDRHPAGPEYASCRHARAKQVPPEGDWFIWFLLAGRGLGKSRAAAEWLVHSATHQEAAEWAVIARNAEGVRKNCRDMTAGIVAVAERDRVLKQYNRHEEDIYLRNGAIIHAISAEKPDRLRGFNLAGAWADELCTWRYPADTWDYGLMPALRAGKHPRVVVTTTPKAIPLIKRLVEEAKAEESKPLAKRSRVITTGSTFENADNLAPNFIEEMLTLRGTRIGRQELEAELLFDTSGSLVTPEMIESGRIYPDRDGFSLEEFMGTLQRVVVAVDPAGSYGEESDETGIVVCAKGRDGHGYVLEDRSCKKSPHEWAAIAAAMYEKWQADAIAAEKNMGHDMVEDVIRSVAPYVRYIPIQAVMGKRLRAEPITALYEQNRIHHLGTFPKLEDQLTSWSPDAKYSPDRMDALVHGFTELGLAKWGLGHVWLDYYKQAVEDDLADPRPMRQAGFYPKYSEAPGAPEPTKCEHRWFPNVDGTYNCAKCGWRKA